MVRNLDRPRAIVLTHDLFGKNRSQQVLGPHALQHHRHLLPALWRMTANARVAFHRHRLVKNGDASTAWVNSRSTIAGRSIWKTSSIGNECCSTSESTIPSSVAAACNSRSKLTQKRFLRARPQARLILPPQGE